MLERLKSLSIQVLIISTLFILSSCCDDKACFQIVRGNLSESECAERLKRVGVDCDDSPNTSVVCEGEPLTICYYKENIDQIKITSDDGTIDQTTSKDKGVIHFTATKTTTITLKPIDSCEEPKSATTYVLNEATDVPITASWDQNLAGQNNCSNVVKKLHETFISPNIFAIEIKANWTDEKVKEAYIGDGVECPTPPFLSVFRPGDLGLGEHAMPVPRQWEKLPRGWEAVGDWAFVPEYIEDCHVRKNCDLRIDFPFVIYMSCDRDEPYRQP